MTDIDQSLEKIQDFFAPEDLHPDLVPHLTKGPLGKMLKHPLVIEIIYNAALNKHINGLYNQKTAALELAKKNNLGTRYVFIHERPWRFQALVDVSHWENVDKEELLDLTVNVFRDTENFWECYSEWSELLSNIDPGTFNDEGGQEAYSKLPETVEVYRGASEDLNEHSFSWTTDYDKAKWFAKRFSSDNPVVVHAKVKREHILGCLNDRGESEIVFDPDFADILKIEDI